MLLIALYIFTPEESFLKQIFEPTEKFAPSQRWHFAQKKSVCLIKQARLLAIVSKFGRGGCQ
jgi:hypothetical protein